MNTPEETKAMVKERYSQIANQGKAQNASSCCGCGATDSSNNVYNIMTDDYSDLKGYNPEADLGLGCGLPTAFAKIQEGDTVLDLGSGAGNDCFVARHETGASGKVIGVDFSETMIQKARNNADKLGYNNVEFRQGDIEHLPVADSVVDVVVSNCVLNLVPDKPAVFREIYRVLKPGGHFSISDIVLVGDLPEALRKDAEMYAGCVAGAIQKSDYMQGIAEAGFTAASIQKEKAIVIPDDILEKYIPQHVIDQFKNGSVGIYSITVFAEKEGTKQEKKKVNLAEMSDRCAPDSGCC
jgi:SAM-dependent methyltransferase